MQFQKRSRDRVSLYIEGQFAMGLPAIEAAKLKVDQVLDARDIEQLLALDTQQRAFDGAVRFLSYRPRSIAEVQRYLQRKAVVDETRSAAIIDRLIQRRYLDDREFTRWWIENRTEFNPRGSHALRQELRQKGVASDIIEEALEKSAIDESGAVESLARRRACRLLGEEKPAFKRKLSGYLLRRGFSYAEVKPVVDGLWEELGTDQAESEQSSG